MSVDKLVPFYNVGVGHFIEDFLESLGWNQQDLAEITGLSLKTINQLINNKQRITTETAILLENAFGTPADFWINIDARYQIEKLKEQNLDKNELVEKKAKLRKFMPIAEMKKKGWFLYDIETIDGIEKECLRVFNNKTIPLGDYESEYNFCARQTNFDNDYTKWYSTTWYKYAYLNSKTFTLPKYDPQGLENIASKLFDFTLEEAGIEHVVKEMNNVGVGFFSLSHLQKTYLDGAAFINGNNPFIVYTCRHDRIDNFWFVLAHEIAHVLHHFDYLKNPILDNLDEKCEDEREKEADYYAGQYLNQEKVIKAGKQYGKYLTQERLENISEETNVALPVALGILQHFGILEWRQFSKFKVPVKNLLPEELILG